MLDPDIGHKFSPRHCNDPIWWQGAEPIWVTATKQGLKSGVYFWPGGEVAVGGVRADLSVPFNASVPYTQRIDTVVGWLAHERVNLAMLYLNEPDKTSHATGSAPTSRATRDVIAECDEHVGYLLRELERHELRVNVMVLSDHGMTDVPRGHVISLAEHVDIALLESVADEGALANILPKEGRTQQVYDSLKDAHPNMSVYLRQELPARLHFSQHKRIHPIIVLPRQGWLVVKVTSTSIVSSNCVRRYDTCMTLADLAVCFLTERVCVCVVQREESDARLRQPADRHEGILCCRRTRLPAQLHESKLQVQTLPLPSFSPPKHLSCLRSS